MPYKLPTRAELILRAERMLVEAPYFRSLCRGKRYELTSVDPRAGRLHVLFESGTTHRITIDDLLAILKELNVVRALPRDYFRNPENSLRVLGRSYWHAPGAAILAILPQLDSHVKINERCCLFLSS